MIKARLWRCGGWRKVAAGLEPHAVISQLPAQLPSVFVAQMEALLSDEGRSQT
jgi:hypothetical protein